MTDVAVIAELTPKSLAGLKVSIVKCLCPMCEGKDDKVRRSYCIHDEIGKEYTILSIDNVCQVMLNATVITVDKRTKGRDGILVSTGAAKSDPVDEQHWGNGVNVDDMLTNPRVIFAPDLKEERRSVMPYRGFPVLPDEIELV